MQFKVIVTFKGVDLEIEGSYTEDSGDRWTPPSNEFIPESIKSVNPGFQDFIDFFNEQISEDEEFINLCINAINESKYPDEEPDDF